MTGTADIPRAKAIGSGRNDAGWREALSYLGALAACTMTTLVATPLIGHVDLANILMLFLLTVVGVAVALGRGPSLLAAFSSVAMFDFFFVPPRFTFTVDDPQY